MSVKQEKIMADIRSEMQKGIIMNKIQMENIKKKQVNIKIITSNL